MVYLFVGQDSLSKDIKLKKIKQEFLPQETQHFNFDIFYAKGLSLMTLQERLLALPVKAKKRIIIIKEAEHLKQEIKEFILKFAKTPRPETLLIIDIDSRAYQKTSLPLKGSQDEFIAGIARYGSVFHFREEAHLDTFVLSRQIEQKKADYSLKVLNQLLSSGEKPERILGGLRYSWQRNITNPLELKKRIRLLLHCDLDIKTGRLKANFALERLIVRLCLR
jgi:DNA polymerase III delta subunit